MAIKTDSTLTKYESHESEATYTVEKGVSIDVDGDNAKVLAALHS